MDSDKVLLGVTETIVLVSSRTTKMLQWFLEYYNLSSDG